MPEISVIVPVYNTERYIHRCLDSILTQTFENFELILVDDGSTDASGGICDEYALRDSRVQVFHQENSGQAAARNYALDWIFANSESKYISFVDSDDWVHPQYLEIMRDGLIQFAVNICQCGHLETDSTEIVPEVHKTISCITPDEQYLNHYSAFMWDKLFSKLCWKDIRFPEGQVYEDVAIWYKLLFQEKRLALTENKLYYYYINQESTARKDWTPAKLAQISAWEDQLRFFRKRGDQELLESAAIHSFQVLFSQLQGVEKSTSLSLKEAQKYETILKKKLFRVVFSFRKWDYFATQKQWVYEMVFPKVFGLYWTVRSVLGKVARLFK